MARKAKETRQTSHPMSKSLPCYEQVAGALREGILAGNQDQPVRLPSERDLCEIHNVSRITIRKALEVLAGEGLIQRSHTHGTFTQPTAIQKWKRLRHDRAIHVLATNVGSAKVEDPSDFFGRICQGIFQQTEEAGYRFSIRHLTIPPAGTPMGLELPPKDSTLGIIFIGRTVESLVEHCTSAGYPVVCVDYWTTDPQADCVVIDCYSEGQIATDFLLRQGHSQLFMLGNQVSRGRMAERESDAELFLAGMQRAMILAGMPPVPPERIRFSGYSKELARQAAEWFMALRVRPTAGLIFSDMMGDFFVEELRARGVRCPEDISLVTKVSEGQATSWTCLRGPTRALGETAVHALLDRAAGRRSSGIRFVLTSVLERGRTVRQISAGSR